MRVKRIGYLGLRTQDTEAMTHFFRDMLGLESAGRDRGATFQRLPTHRRDRVEVFAFGHHDTRMIPDGVDLVVGFIVEDIHEALADAKAAGLEIVGEPVWERGTSGGPGLSEHARFWVRTPDRRVFAFEQVPD